MWTCTCIWVEQILSNYNEGQLLIFSWLHTSAVHTPFYLLFTKRNVHRLGSLHQLHGLAAAGVYVCENWLPKTVSHSSLSCLKNFSHQAKGKKQFHGAKMTIAHHCNKTKKTWKAIKQPIVCKLFIHQLHDQKKQQKEKLGSVWVQKKAKFVT